MDYNHPRRNVWGGGVNNFGDRNQVNILISTVEQICRERFAIFTQIMPQPTDPAPRPRFERFFKPLSNGAENVFG